MKRLLSWTSLFSVVCGFSVPNAFAFSDYLVKFRDASEAKGPMQEMKSAGVNSEFFHYVPWARLTIAQKSMVPAILAELKNDPNVIAIQPNYKLRLINNFKASEEVLAALAPYQDQLMDESDATALADNPAIPPAITNPGSGADPLVSNQWGMRDIGVARAWERTTGNPEVVVGVIDTGVDYTHEDLLPNMWRNSGETGRDANGADRATNGIDDDQNGYIDDIVGWDFAKNDNKPYDMTTSLWEMMMGGGNPGHGTHCAGNVAARGNNSKGIAGVAPNVRIMALRFLTEKGQGTTADAIKAIEYGVRNGARVLSNSWGSEGEDSSEGASNKALQDAISLCQEKGVLFVAAAGNGHSGVGYDNDTDAKPAYPASYNHDIIVSVAALDVNNNFGSFSCWGKRSVDLGAPGVRVYSTVPGNQYSDTVMNMFGTTVYWDGTSMATPHVAGAAALYWSAYPHKSWQEVKAALMSSTRKLPALANKLVTGGKLNVEDLMR